MKYIALAEGLANRNLIPTSHNIFDYLKKDNKDYYISLYKYNQEHFKKFKQTKSLSGIKDVKTDRILFDFDDSTDLEGARADAITLCGRLIEKGIPQEQICVFFSGGKGFHVEVNTNEEFSRKEFKNIVFNLAGDLETFDPRINDEQRVIRAPLTMHPETKLYKKPISLDQLSETPIDIIKEMAKTVDEETDVALLNSWVNIDLPDQILELTKVDYKPEKEVELDLADLSFDKFQLNLKSCPKWLAPERYALQEGFFMGSESQAAGDRNDAFMILASTYKNQGINKKIAQSMLEATADLQAARTGETRYEDWKIEKEIVDVVFSGDWNGGQYTAEHPLLEKTRKTFDIKREGENASVVSNNEMFSSFKDYAINLDKNTIKTGLPIDNDVKLTIGMPVALLGAPSSGKTTVTLNILRNTSKSGLSSMFFSMDMHKALICQKQLQLICPEIKSHKDFPSGLRNASASQLILGKIGAPKFDAIFSEKLDEEFGNVYYCTKAGLSIEDIRYHVEKKKEQDPNLKLIMIDYLECITGPYSDPTTNSAIIANGIKNLAVELDLCVILLVQPPKITGGAAYPLTNMYQIKGSSMVAQAMRTVIGIYREGFSPETTEQDNYISFVGLKNSMGSLFKRDCHWNGSTGEIRELKAHEEQNLKDFREELERKRNDNDF